MQPGGARGVVDGEGTIAPAGSERREVARDSSNISRFLDQLPAARRGVKKFGSALRPIALS
jgi:hypothetical protein